MSININNDIENQIDESIYTLISIKTIDYVRTLQNAYRVNATHFSDIIKVFDEKISANITNQVNEELSNIISDSFENINYNKYKQKFTKKTISKTTATILGTIDNVIDDPKYIKKYVNPENNNDIQNTQQQLLESQINKILNETNKEYLQAEQIWKITNIFIPITTIIGFLCYNRIKNYNNNKKEIGW